MGETSARSNVDYCQFAKGGELLADRGARPPRSPSTLITPTSLQVVISTVSKFVSDTSNE